MDVEDAVRATLETWGFRVEKIPETDVPTPDFIVCDDSAAYLVEVKTRGDDPALTRARDQVLRRGEVFTESLALVRHNRISSIIGHANRQLAKFMNDDQVFRVVWVVVTGRATDAKCLQIQASLYGSTTIIDFESVSNGFECYYFRESDFFRDRDVLDGAVVSNLDSGKLCLNTLSPRYITFKHAKLAAQFAAGLVDPVAQEAAGTAFIVDSDIDRKNQAAVIEYLQRKYKRVRLMNIDLGYHSAAIAVPTNGNKGT